MGQNIHQMDEEQEQDLLDIDQTKIHKQINNLKELKANRDNGQSKFLLEQLESAAKSNDNIMPFVISCIRSKCTLGEIADVFRSTFGEYQ